VTLGVGRREPREVAERQNGDPAFLQRVADVVLGVSVYPYTSMELMAVADLCVHFQSAAVLEAAFAGVPSLSVGISQEHRKGYPTYAEFYGAQPDTLQNFPGVVWSATPAEAIARLDGPPWPISGWTPSDAGPTSRDSWGSTTRGRATARWTSSSAAAASLAGRGSGPGPVAASIPSMWEPRSNTEEGHP
jgi:hypothetical protein